MFVVFIKIEHLVKCVVVIVGTSRLIFPSCDNYKNTIHRVIVMAIMIIINPRYGWGLK